MEFQDVIIFCQDDFLRTSFAHFEDMRKTGDLCDVTIKGHNGSLTAHRVILAAGIPYFRKVFTNVAKTENGEISVTDLDAVALESVIHFAYSSRITVSVENVRSLLQASQFLQIDKLFEACVEFLSKRICLNSVLEIRTLGLNLQNSNLVEACNSFIRNNFEQFSKSDDLKKLSGLHLKEIISEDELSVSSEKVVIEAVFSWVKNSPMERQTMLPELLSEVRMIYLPVDYLVQRVSSEELIRNLPSCRNQIDEVKSYHLRKNSSVFTHFKKQPRKYNSVKPGIYLVCQLEYEPFIYYCDFVDDTWIEVGSEKLPPKERKDTVYNVASVNEKIYMFFRKTIHRFDLKTLEWKVLECKHNGINGAGIAPYGGVIYIFGSYDVDLEGKVRRFDTQQERWMNEETMRTSRCTAAAASMRDSIYVTGGYTDGLCLNTVERYNPLTVEWSRVTPMLRARRRHGCVAMNEKLYVCGGSSGTDILRIAEVYDPLTNKWKLISSMNIEKYTISLVPYNRKIYALGPQGVYTRPETEIYDPESDKWELGIKLLWGFRSAVSLSFADD